MKTIELVQQQHNVKIGDICGDIEPNITEDTLFVYEGKPVGFYIREIEGRLKDYVNIANAELLSERVPKTEMSRGPQGNKKDKLERLKIGKELTIRDNFVTADHFGVQLNGYNDGQQEFRFFVSAAGVQMDCVYTEANDEDFSWDAIWDSRTAITETGWVVEMKIPYAALRFPTDVKQTCYDAILFAFENKSVK